MLVSLGFRWFPDNFFLGSFGSGLVEAEQYCGILKLRSSHLFPPQPPVLPKPFSIYWGMRYCMHNMGPNTKHLGFSCSKLFHIPPAAKGRRPKSSKCRLLEGVADPADDGDADGGDEEGGTANAWEFAAS